MTMNDPLLRTDSYAKSSCIPMKPSPVCRATPSACAIKCARTSCAKPVSRHCCAFAHDADRRATETAFRYRRNVQPAVVLD